MKSSKTYTPILEGQHNFRDLGGLPAAKGSVIRTGVLFRSGDLSAITDQDIALLEHLSLATIIDFRSERERRYRPNRPVATVREIKSIAIDDPARDQVAAYLEANDAAGLENLLINDYRRIVRENHGAYQRFLGALADGVQLPVVFHCAAGKDRTGLAVVFLLTALGVDFDAIYDDYIASSQRNAALNESFIAKLNAQGRNGEIIRPLLEVKRTYLDAALTEINETYGSLDAFVVDALKADTEKLREKFLEPVCS